MDINLRRVSSNDQHSRDASSASVTSPNLDEEIQKLFEPLPRTKFSLASFRAGSPPGVDPCSSGGSSHRLQLNEFASAHRSETFPNIRAPLGAIPARNPCKFRRRVKKGKRQPCRSESEPHHMTDADDITSGDEQSGFVSLMTSAEQSQMTTPAGSGIFMTRGFVVPEESPPSFEEQLNEEEPLLKSSPGGRSDSDILASRAKQVARAKQLAVDIHKANGKPRDEGASNGMAPARPAPLARGASSPSFGRLSAYPNVKVVEPIMEEPTVIVTSSSPLGHERVELLSPEVEWRIGSDDNTPRSTPRGGRSPTIVVEKPPHPILHHLHRSRIHYIRSQSVPSHGIMDKMKAAAAADDDRRSSDAMPSPLYRPVDDDAPQVSQRAALAARADRGESLRQGQVQFEVGSLTDVRDENGKIKGKHRKDKSRREEDPTWRIRSGSEIEPSFQQARLNPTEADEASTLGHADLDDMASHRYDHVKHSRRHRNSHNLVHISRKDGADVLPQLMKKTIDHAPHDIFVQLDELYVTLSGQEWEWKQTARWIKYEENVEEGGKWGKAHVASLSFHSLLNLRKCLEQGVVLLDLEADDMTGVVNRVVEQLVISDQIHPEDRGAVLRTLLLRHKAVDDNEAFFKNLNDKGAWPKLVPSLTNLAGQDGLSCSVSNMNPNLLSPNEATGYVRSGSIRFGSISSYRDVESAADALGSQGLRHVPSNSILRKIPAGSEATMVLVGAVDFLELPAVAFIRLAKGTTFPGVTEVPIPTRFLFFLLGPLNTDLDYHEIGRSIGTLMSNPGFNEVAYKTETRRDLLCAINEFLDDSIVLPPGEWESKTLLHIEDLQMKSREIRERKKQRLEMEKQLERQSLTVQDEKALAVVAADGMRLSLGGDGGPPDDPLERTGHLFGGMFRDIKRRYPKYLSDLRDALNPVCLATAVFIYFAALSGAITFGGLYGAKTDNLIGVSETLIATAFTGVMFALFAGQPLIIVGATGPVLLFDQSLFSFCASQGIDFLPLRVWVGMWLGVIGLIFTAFEGACFVRFFTRFTEEIFASLVSLLFIFESFFKLYTVYRDHPLLADYCFVTESTIATLIANETVNGTLPMTTTMSPMTTFASSNITLFGLDRVRREIADQGVTVEEDALPMNEPNTALMSTVLMLGTFFIAYFLRHFRNSKFLGRSARRALGDFGVPIAIVTMVVVDYLVEDTYTEKLSVPEGLSPSNSKVRGWLISPFAENLPTWMIFAAALPAVLVFILIFMETQICQLIINKKCTKGSGHHLDIALLCLLNMLCALFGAPWQPAATVRAVSHVSALTVWSTNQAPGEKPKILEVKEQRVTNLIVALMVGLSVLMAPILKQVPLAVLFGVFLYMGISSTNGIQFFERLQLLTMPVKHHPRVNYVRKVRTWKMHMFTLIQILCLVVLWVVKSTAAALAFPFVLLLMIPIRKLLTQFFTPRELMALDGKSDDAMVDDEEPDFFVQAHDIS